MAYKDMFENDQQGVVVYCPRFSKDVTVWFNDSGKVDENGKRLWSFNGCEHYGGCEECAECRKNAVRAAWGE